MNGQGSGWRHGEGDESRRLHFASEPRRWESCKSSSTQMGEKSVLRSPVRKGVRRKWAAVGHVPVPGAAPEL